MQAISAKAENQPTDTSDNTDRDESDKAEESEFYDAKSEPSDDSLCEMSLEQALDEAKLAICYFFNNKFNEARELMKPYSDVSMYHAMGTTVFIFLEAILTFEPKSINLASEELKKCLNVCQRYRKKNTITQAIGKTFKKTNYDQLSDLEAHAELCFAEALLLKALLTFIEDETLSSLIRGGIKIRNCFGSYKECVNILKKRQWQSEIAKTHFESGVCMGVGTFNLMISLLPVRVIKILEFIGFSGNKTSGLDELNKGYKLTGLRQVLCSLTLLGYNLIVCYVLSHKDGDLQLCSEILDEQLKNYPEGVWFLFFKGRLEFMKGNLDEAQHWYKKSWKSQNVWPQFHHISFWELLWVNCLKLDWREASLYATYLVEESNWSRSIYSYQKAAILLSMNHINETEQETVYQLMIDVPKYTKRIAGKSLPMEKFVCKRSKRYFAQNKWLCLPAIELMYLWNALKVVKKNYQLADGIYQVIQKQMHLLESKKLTDLNYYDNYALCLLLRGSCYRQMHKNFLAMQDFQDCMALENNIKEDKFLVAYAYVELGLIHADENRYDLAITILEDAKKKYTGFSLESRLHFRIHSALLELKESSLAN